MLRRSAFVRTVLPTMGSRSILLVAIGTVLVLLLLAAGTAAHLVRGDRNARAVVATLLATDSRSIEKTLDRHFLQADASLASIPILLTGLADSGVETTPKASAGILAGLAFQCVVARSIMLIEPDGAVWASSRAATDPRAGVDPTILPQRSGSVPHGLLGPVRDRVTGEWSIFLARNVGVPGHGTMRAVAEIPVPTLVSLVSELRLNVKAKILVRKATGEVIANAPYDRSLIGQVVPSATAADRLDRVVSLPDRGGGDETFAVSRHSLSADVYVSLTSAASEALAKWRTERDRALVTAALAAILVLVVGATLLVLLRRSERMAQERTRVATVLETAIEGMADGFVMWDEKDRLVTCNDVYRNLYQVSRPFLVPGLSFEEIIRRGAEAGQYPAAEGRIEEFVQEIVSWHREGKGALERLLPDGRWLLIRERRMADGGIVGIRTDITALKTAQAELAVATAGAERAAEEARRKNLELEARDRELHKQNALFQAALDNMSHGLLMVDANERLIVANPRFADVFGIEAAALRPGLSMQELLAIVRQADALHSDVLDDIARQQGALAAAGAWGAFTSQSPSGRVIAVTQRPLDEGGWVAIYEDVTSLRLVENRVQFLAGHDDLTKLPNRARFRAEVDQRLAALERGAERFALLHVDLDGFKDVNDTFGHLAGDLVLREVTRRLLDCSAEGDLVARLGGDEFAIVRGTGADPGIPAAVADGIVKSLSRPFEVCGHRIAIGGSIGIALASRALDREMLLRNADLALHEAKSSGRGRWRMFDPDLERRRTARVRLEQDLREAIEREAFTVDYQPIFDLRQNRIAGFEALIRWHHASRGWVSPAEFIPVAEEIGLIGAIGKRMLETACRDIARLPGEPRVAVNLSAEQLRSPDVVETVAAALASGGLPADRLELEITETALLAESTSTTDILQRLSALGLGIALDDFGTGYSSLSHLRNFPLDKIKIDKSFVREMTFNQESAAIVTSVIDLAGKLGMTTTAEGIETEEQLRAIRAAGCDEAQGYLLGRPRSILRALETVEGRPPVDLDTRARRSA